MHGTVAREDYDAEDVDENGNPSAPGAVRLSCIAHCPETARSDKASVLLFTNLIKFNQIMLPR